MSPLDEKATSSKEQSRVAGSSANATTTSDGSQQQELWFMENERWELTWPIWHMLSWTERKEIAFKHGFKKIGEFEEYMTLQRAVGDSSGTQGPYENGLIYPSSQSTEETHLEATTSTTVDGKVSEVDDEEENESGDEEYNKKILAEESDEKLATEELMDVGGKILMLPDEMLHRVFEWLYVDAYATLALVSPHWKSFTRTEAVYKRLCERLYLNQSKRRALHVSRFGNSYLKMLAKRPRVRAGGGCYVMKFTRVKKIQRDMWTEIPAGAILESTYYRYLYFQEDGRVLYALTSAPPYEMFRRFLKVCLTRDKDYAAVWGKYVVHKNEVVVTAKQDWQYVQLKMTIQPNTMHGRYGYLSFDEHTTSTSDDFDNAWSPHHTVYKVPDEPFRFVRDKRL